jgi:hypothetical protein
VSGNLRGKVDLETGRVIDLATGITYSWMQWETFKRLDIANYAQELQAMRDPASDLQNLWGCKADRFSDNWFSFFPPQRPPSPWEDFPPDYKDQPIGTGQPSHPGGPLQDLPGIL